MYLEKINFKTLKCISVLFKAHTACKKSKIVRQPPFVVLKWNDPWLIKLNPCIKLFIS